MYQFDYAPNLPVSSNPENDNAEKEDEDDLTSHIYKRKQVERDDNELDAYLKSLNPSPKTNVLAWWKVSQFLFLIILYLYLDN
jgi:hypothetical protein